jgi:uncharacterized protein YjiS (DUF1127 family)
MHSVPANRGRARRISATQSFRRWAAKGFSAILAWWRLSRARAAERHALAALSDRGLRDIGLTRAEAEGESRYWPGRP